MATKSLDAYKLAVILDASGASKGMAALTSADRAASAADASLGRLGKTSERTSGVLGRVFARLRSAGARDATSLSKSLDGLKDSLGGVLDTFGGGLGRFSPLAGGSLLGGGMVGGFTLAATAGVKYAETLDKLNKSFTTLTGSAAGARAHLRDLQRFASNTPFEFEDVARASQKFQAMGVKAGEVIPVLRAVGNAVALVGGGSAEVEQVSRALAQVMARGKVSAEEMNQLSDALVDGWGPLEKMLGRTRGELMKMAEQGQISADTFIKAFRQAHEGGNAMQKQMQTLTGALSTLKDEGKNALAEAFAPLHSTLRNISVELAGMTQRGFSASSMFKALAGSAAEFTPSIGGIPSTAILAQLEAERNGAGQGVAAAPDLNASVNRFRDEFKAKREALTKELDKLAPARDLLSGLQADIRTFGDKSNVAVVTEQFRRLHEQLAASGEVFSDGAAAKLNEWQRASMDAARQLDALVKRQKEKEEADKRAADASDVHTRAVETARKTLADLLLTQKNYGVSAAEALGNTLKLSTGIIRLTGEQEKLTEAGAREVGGLIQRAMLLSNENTLEGTLRNSKAANLDALRGELTEVQKVNGALGEYLRTVEALTGRMPLLTDAQMKLAESARHFAKQKDFSDFIKSVNGMAFDALPVGNVADFKLPDGPYVDPASNGAAPPPPKPNMLREAWKEFVTLGDETTRLKYAFVDLANSMRPQGQAQGGKRGFFSKLLGIASPFLNLIPGVGPILSLAADIGSRALAGDYAGAVMGAAGGFASGGAFRSSGGSNASGPYVNPATFTAEFGAPPPPTGIRRANGGPVRKGRAYTVGDRGPRQYWEVFEPETDGYVYPSVEAYEGSRRGSSSSGGAGGGPQGRGVMGQALSRLIAQLERMESRPAGDWLRMASKENPGAITDGFMRGASRDPKVVEWMERRRAA